MSEHNAGTVTAETVEGFPTVEAWPRLDAAAYHGIAGQLVGVVAPYSEADPVAMLLHILAAAGNVIGPGPYVAVGNDRHLARLNVAVVGPTGKGRKGSGWSGVRPALAEADPDWAARRIRSGLSSGEGLIYHVRDARHEQQPIREKGRVVDYQDVVVDPGEPDKRLLCLEPELASVFKRMAGDSNTLSALLRQAYDDGTLATLTKNSPLMATGAHISVIGHITIEELQASLTATETVNGFANRFIYCLARRAQILPDGEPVPAAEMDPVKQEMRALVAAARAIGQVRRDADATELWRATYPRLSEGEPGLVGAVLGRAEAHVLRLSLVYALLDASPVIRVPHLEAAVALWQYADASARRIFAGRLGISLADTLLDLLRERGPMTTTEIYAEFGRHRSKTAIHTALEVLRRAGKAHPTTRQTGGRPSTTWEATA